MKKTACVFGSTGLTGSVLTELLTSDERYERIIIFNRSGKEYFHPKIIQIVADYELIGNYVTELAADEYYCCLGTTIKKAKTKEAFEYVDYGLPLKIAQIATENQTGKYLVVSSIGASDKSSNFYLRTKGKMEQAVSKSGVNEVYFFRPSILLGQRNEKRLGESIGQIAMKATGFLLWGPLQKYRAIQARTVAAAMIAVANEGFENQIIESDEIEKLGKAQFGK